MYLEGLFGALLDERQCKASEIRNKLYGIGTETPIVQFNVVVQRVSWGGVALGALLVWRLFPKARAIGAVIAKIAQHPGGC